MPSLNSQLKDIKSLFSLAPERLISWKVFWALTPFSVLTAIFYVQPNLGSKSDLLAWTAIGMMSHASMIPFVFYGNGSFKRPMHVFLALCMGFVRGGTIGLLAPVLQVHDPVPLAVRVLNSMITVPFGIFVAAILITVWSDFSRDLRLVLADAMSNNSFEVAKSNETLSIENKNSHKEIQGLISNLNKYFQDVAESSGTLSSLSEQAQAIDDLIKGHIRPHSAKRWKESELIWPRIRFGRVLHQALMKTPLPIIPVLIVTLPLSLFGSIVRFGFILGFLIVAATGLLILLIARVTERLSRFYENRILYRNIFFCIGLILFSIPFDLIIATIFRANNKISTSSFLSAQLSTIITYVFLTCLASIVWTVKVNRLEAVNLLRNSLSRPALQGMVDKGVTASINSEFAQYLHAEVQSQLLACKLLLLKAADSNFENFPTEVTQKVLQRLKTLETPYEKRPPRIPSVRLNNMCKTWQGLAEISLDLGPELSEVSRNGEVIAQLIEESIVNAIRHGKAKKIQVKAWVVDSTCFISVQDNGTLKSSKHKGLGSTLFEVFAPDWVLATNPVGTLATMSAKF